MDICSFLQIEGPLFDVRSPSEWGHGRVSEAENLPLLSDEERALVGTTYHMDGQSEAIGVGLQCVADSLPLTLSKLKKSDRPIRLYCWRGGLRSQSVATLCRTIGLEAHILQGGYKSFRRWVLQTLQTPLKLHVLGGMTGSGKTARLMQLQEQGEQILNLEGLANHKGSLFGDDPTKGQPSNEQFENLIACAIAKLSGEKRIYIEDESRMIGSCKIPDPLFLQLQRAPFELIEASKEERVRRILADYAHISLEEAKLKILRLSRLGHEKKQQALEFIANQDREGVVRVLLTYYDRAYAHSLKHKNR